MDINKLGLKNREPTLFNHRNYEAVPSKTVALSNRVSDWLVITLLLLLCIAFRVSSLDIPLQACSSTLRNQTTVATICSGEVQLAGSIFLDREAHSSASVTIIYPFHVLDFHSGIPRQTKIPLVASLLGHCHPQERYRKS